MFRSAGYSFVATNNSHDAGGRGDISHETLRRQRFVGSRCQKQGEGKRKQGGRGTTDRRGKDARSGITYLSCILLSILSENQYLIYIIYSLHNPKRVHNKVVISPNSGNLQFIISSFFFCHRNIRHCVGTQLN